MNGNQNSLIWESSVTFMIQLSIAPHLAFSPSENQSFHFRTKLVVVFFSLKVDPAFLAYNVYISYATVMTNGVSLTCMDVYSTVTSVPQKTLKVNKCEFSHTSALCIRLAELTNNISQLFITINIPYPSVSQRATLNSFSKAELKPHKYRLSVAYKNEAAYIYLKLCLVINALIFYLSGLLRWR